jgi:hypothetical protein
MPESRTRSNLVGFGYLCGGEGVDDGSSSYFQTGYGVLGILGSRRGSVKQKE